MIDSNLYRLWFVGVLGISACQAEEGASLEISNVPVLTDDCVIPTQPPFKGEGSYDPRGIRGYVPPEGYLLALVINNRLAAQNDTAVVSGSQNVRPAANNAHLMGFDICWFRADAGEGAKYNAYEEGVPKKLRCDKLKDSQRGFFPSSGTIEPNGGELAASVLVMTLDNLHSLYGAAFTPADIPDLGAVQDSFGAWYYAFQTEDPSDLSTRSAGRARRSQC